METTPNTKIEKNGLTFDLVRDETKAKEGRENVSFWNLPSGATLAVLNDEEKKAMITGDETSTEYKAAATKVIDTYIRLLGHSKVIDYIVARVDATMRSAQLEQGKDNWTMEQKLERARDYILKSDFGRNRQGGISALANKLESAKVLSSVQADLITRYQALTLAKTDADKANIQAEILVLMGKLTMLTK